MSNDPSLPKDHFSLSQSASFIGTDVCDRTEGFQGIEFSNNNVTLNHLFSTDCHGDSKYYYQRSRNHGKSRCNSIINDFGRGIPLIRTKDNDGKDDRNCKQQDRQFREFPLERSSNINTQKASDGIKYRQSTSFDIAMRSSLSI